MRQAGVLHDVGNASTAVSAASDGSRGGPDDALVGDFLAPGAYSRGPFLHDDHHIIILTKNARTFGKMVVILMWAVGPTTCARTSDTAKLAEVDELATASNG